jgi:two-component system cell cycle sensor histidine kinase/response regulator CckA
LAELAHLLRRLIGENIELKISHERDLRLVKADQGQLEQVIINLAVNARDAMPGGGDLSIGTSNASLAQDRERKGEIMPAGDYVLIRVSDTGSGIEPENLDRIFEPFFSTKGVGEGTGLGLATVYGIIKQSGGFVFVESRPGEGTEFSIYLPGFEGAEEETTAAETGSLVKRDLSGRGTLLLVEDEDAVRSFGARALRNKGYTVLEANSGEAAVTLLEEETPDVDLVITDVVMPKLDGPGLVQHIRQATPDIKVIFISGYTEDAFRKSLGEDEHIHFLPKPFSLKQLAGKVKEVLEE